MRRVLRFVLLTTVPSVLAAQAPWQLDDEPAQRVPGTTADGSVQFSSVTSAVRLADGSIVILDATDAKVRVADATGRVVRSFGTRGRGPGEFQLPFWAGRCGADTVYVWDMALARMSVFSVKSGLVRDFSVEGAPQAMTAACSAQGDVALLVATPASQTAGAASGEMPDGSRWEHRPMAGAVRVLDRTGTQRFQVSGLIWNDMISAQIQGRFGGFMRPLGDRTGIGFAEHALVVASTDSARVVTYDSTGAVARQFAVPRQGAPTRAQYEAAIKPANAMVPLPMQEPVAAVLRAVPPPPQLPTFSAMYVDPAGITWLVTSPLGASRTWLAAYSPQGQRVAMFPLAGAIAIHDVGLDYILGSTEDDDGEPVVVLYRLRRP